MRPVYLETEDASGGEIISSVVPMDIYLNPFSVSLASVVTGTVEYTVEWTQDDIFAEDYDPNTGNWIVVAGMEDATADAQATFGPSPVRAFRMRQTSGDGSVRLAIVQAGAVS